MWVAGAASEAGHKRGTSATIRWRGHRIALIGTRAMTAGHSAVCSRSRCGFTSQTPHEADGSRLRSAASARASREFRVDALTSSRNSVRRSGSASTKFRRAAARGWWVTLRKLGNKRLDATPDRPRESTY